MPMNEALVAQIDALLPQTQCTQCGFPRCHDYADALARGVADINQCPPGAEVTIFALSKLLTRPAKALDPAFGVHRARTRALIDERRCIGCTLCVDVCPVDAIVGANKRMHSVIADDCTGCELCLPPCPVDCIDLVPAAARPPLSQWPEYGADEVARARQRNRRHVRRMQRQAEQTALTRLHRRLRGAAGKRRIRQQINAALERVRAAGSNTTPAE